MKRVASYSRAPCFDRVAVCDFLEIDTAITSSTDYLRTEGKTDRLVSLDQQANASRYIRGPSARDYIETAAFAAAGVDIRWFVRASRQHSGSAVQLRFALPRRHEEISA